MWEKFKESKFAKKCREMSGKRGVVIATLCLVMALAVILSISISTNRAKKKYAGESEGTTNNRIEENTEKKDDKGKEDATVEAPVHNNESEAPVGAEPEEFELALPVGAGGVISKGHDSTIQVWSDTMGDYRVHLGIDIATEKGAPVFAAADGVVAKVWDDALMGRCVAISHDDEIFTFYKNLDPILSEGIAVDAKVESGQQIGKVGESAIAELADEPHLHMEMTVNGLSVDPRDYFSDKTLETLSKDVAFESGASDMSDGNGSETEITGK
jgi:murein DD-endopeptidase MepM/ murein hydrolase activator NlpD